MKHRSILMASLLLVLSPGAMTEAQTQNHMGPAWSRLAQLPAGDATLDCSFMDFPEYAEMTAHLRGGGPFGFRLMAQPAGLPGPDPSQLTLIGTAPTNVDGEGHFIFKFRHPRESALPASTEFFAIYRDLEGTVCIAGGTPFVMNPPFVGKVDFNWDSMGRRLLPGEEITGQLMGAGIQVLATNNMLGHPNKAIIYDSTDPFGADPDLVTPGAGFMNDYGYRNLLVIAENAVDANGDGLIDRPDDEQHGGMISFVFSRPTQVYKVVLVDVDMHESAAMHCYMDNAMVMDLQVHPMGDNGVERIGLGAERLNRLDVEFSGSGAIAELWLVGAGIRPGIRHEEPVRFDLP